MIRKKSTLFLFILIAVSIVFTAEGADRGVNVSASMRKAMGAYMQLQSAAKGDDYFKIANNFWELAVVFQELSHAKAPRGSDAEWTMLTRGIVEAAFRGIGACGLEDKDAVNKAIKEIGEIQRKGHGAFR